MTASQLTTPLQLPEQAVARVQAGLDEANRRFVGLVKERPGTVLVGAVAIGYVVGRLAARG